MFNDWRPRPARPRRSTLTCSRARSPAAVNAYAVGAHTERRRSCLLTCAAISSTAGRIHVQRPSSEPEACFRLPSRKPYASICWHRAVLPDVGSKSFARSQ